MLYAEALFIQLDKGRTLRLSAQVVFTRQSTSNSKEIVSIEVGDFFQRCTIQSPVSDSLEPIADTLLRGIALKVGGPGSKTSLQHCRVVDNLYIQK
jgi:hypothetical protein